jgi:hypothetical protein
MLIFMEDVDVLHEEYQQSGTTIPLSPTNMPRGTREMNAQDPDVTVFAWDVRPRMRQMKQGCSASLKLNDPAVAVAGRKRSRLQLLARELS